MTVWIYTMSRASRGAVECIEYMYVSMRVCHVELENDFKSDPDCTPSITVPRNTVWRARVTDFLMINCTVVSESHCWKNMEVSWCRIDDINGCRPLKHSSNIHIITEWR
ncbi:hypothetical protein AMELA_G00109090, partial [Ameiurus melas]